MTLQEALDRANQRLHQKYPNYNLVFDKSYLVARKNNTGTIVDYGQISEQNLHTLKFQHCLGQVRFELHLLLTNKNGATTRHRLGHFQYLNSVDMGLHLTTKEFKTLRRFLKFEFNAALKPYSRSSVINHWFIIHGVDYKTEFFQLDPYFTRRPQHKTLYQLTFSDGETGCYSQDSLVHAMEYLIKFNTTLITTKKIIKYEWPDPIPTFFR